jgi:hypothetical protein
MVVLIDYPIVVSEGSHAWWIVGHLIEATGINPHIAQIRISAKDLMHTALKHKNEKRG